MSALLTRVLSATPPTRTAGSEATAWTRPAAKQIDAQIDALLAADGRGIRDGDHIRLIARGLVQSWPKV